MPPTNEHGQPVGEFVPHWSRRPRPAREQLQGRYVGLEPVTLDHSNALFTALCGPDDRPLWTYRPTEPPSDTSAMGQLLAPLVDAPDTVTWALVPASGSPAGMTTFMRIDELFGQVEVAAVIYARTLQRTPAATEAIHLLMSYAFDRLGYRRFEWKCDSLNEPSRRAAVRLGFRYEGRFRHHMVTKGRNRDTDWFSVTEDEWPDVGAAHRRWLAPSNFDSSGRQLVALSDLTRALG